MERPAASFSQVWNLSCGFLGIQFGWALQTANMSAIYEYLGAKSAEIPALWLAAPVTGLIVQPLIGAMSDLTWGRLGRRRPYLLTGTVFACLALLLMPLTTRLWMAVTLLWLLDVSINVSMEPYRAFVADQLPRRQRGYGFAVQCLFIGLGSVVASALPWMFAHGFGVSGQSTPAQPIPSTVRYAFDVGALAFLGTVLWTVSTTREYPPTDLAAFALLKASRRGWKNRFKEIVGAIADMPPTMRRLAGVQTLTWTGIFCMGLYFVPVVAHNVFGAVAGKSRLYAEGVEWGGLCFAFASLIGFFTSFALIALSTRVKLKLIHAVCLFLGGVGLLSVAVIHDKYLLLLPMVGIGMAGASLSSMPYAMLANVLPEARAGVYMGIFNLFIVLPEVAVSLGMGSLMGVWLHGNRLYAVVIGGVFLLLAAALTPFVPESDSGHELAENPPA